MSNTLTTHVASIQKSQRNIVAYCETAGTPQGVDTDKIIRLCSRVGLALELVNNGLSFKNVQSGLQDIVTALFDINRALDKCRDENHVNTTNLRKNRKT